MVGPDNVGIEDESINHALSDSEVEDTNNDHKKESCSSKEDEECQIIVVRAVDAVERSNSQAVALLAATTQSTSSIEGTLGTWIVLKINSFFTTVAIVKWTILS